jgi:hypothetical protein
MLKQQWGCWMHSTQYASVALCNHASQASHVRGIGLCPVDIAVFCVACAFENPAVLTAACLQQSGWQLVAVAA